MTVALHVPTRRSTQDERIEIEEFLAYEALLADESRYSEWEALLDDDMVYWVPTREGAQHLPGEKISIIFDNRTRLATRVRQLNTGKRHSQVPASPMVRVLSNFHIEVGGDEDGREVFTVRCSQILYEYRIQSTRELVTWPARVEYRLRRNGGELRIHYKAVFLAAASDALPGLPFLI